MPAGTINAVEVSAKYLFVTSPEGEHVVRPHGHREAREGEQRDHERRVAEEAPAENVAMTSPTIPTNGKNITYTTGCP